MFQFWFQERFAYAFTKRQLIILARRTSRHHNSEELKPLTSFWGVLYCLCEKRLQQYTVSEQKRTGSNIKWTYNYRSKDWGEKKAG
jgi:hypothetical protein